MYVRAFLNCRFCITSVVGPVQQCDCIQHVRGNKDVCVPKPLPCGGTDICLTVVAAICSYFRSGIFSSFRMMYSMSRENVDYIKQPERITRFLTNRSLRINIHGLGLIFISNSQLFESGIITISEQCFAMTRRRGAATLAAP